MTNCSIRYGDMLINYSVEYRERKNIAISVLPDLSVIASVPSTTSEQKIRDIIKKRARWILKQKNYFSDFLPKQPAHKYLSGETHYYLGKQYKLKIFKSESNEVKLKGGLFIVKLQSRNDALTIKGQMYQWYKDRAVNKFQMLLDRMYDCFKRFDIDKPNLQIKIMKSRWGSCIPDKNKIILNLELIKTSTQCIEYVIVHELCHLKFPNHDKKFYNLVASVLPDWQKRKQKLEKSHL